jgi:hypothetical protein
MDEMLAAQERAYKALPSERYADDFATNFLLSHQGLHGGRRP